MSSSEPRLTRATAGELTGDVANPLKSNVPFTTHILLVGSMLLFFVAATLITLQATWQWWLIEVAIAIPVLVVLVERYTRARGAREARRAMEAELRAAGGPGRSRSTR